MSVSSRPLGRFTNPISITSQFPFCGLPLRLDTYAGCAFRCSYCFARYRSEATFGSDLVRPANPDTIRRIFRFAIDLKRFPEGIVAQCLRRRMPIHFGGMSDGFQPAERKYRVSEAALTVLAKYRYPTVISTRGAMIAEPNYVALLRAIGPVVVQFSFCTTKDSTARNVEPFATPPSVLLRTMETLANKEIIVTCRWQPYIPGISEEPAEFVPSVTSAGARHIALEHLKLAVEGNHPLSAQLARAAGTDILKEYKKRGMRKDGREYVLDADAKLAVIRETARLAKSQKVSFGAADNEFQYLSDSACCCSGVDQFPGFENWFKHQIGYAIRLCKGKEITYSSIAREWIPKGSVDWYVNTRSRLSTKLGRKATMRDHIKAKWNSLIAPGCPASFYGVTLCGLSANRQNVYAWTDCASA
jgi:DNA repair photolyase